MTVAAEIAAELKALENDTGVLLPEDVIKMASDSKTASHSHFTWNNDKAAHERRIDQARALIRSVFVDVTVKDKTVRVCAYVRDPDADQNVAGYRNVIVVRSDKDLMREALVEEMNRVGYAMARARNLAIVFDAEDTVNEIDALAKSIIKKVEITESPEEQ